MRGSSNFRATFILLSLLQLISIGSSQSGQNCQEQAYFFGITLCTECKPGYKFNLLSQCIQCNEYDTLPTCQKPQSTQTQPKNKISNDFESKEINCLFFNERENVCLECKTGYGLDLKRQCIKGLKGTPIRFIIDDHTTQTKTQTKLNTFLEQYYGGQIIFPTQKLDLNQSPQDLIRSLTENGLINPQESVGNCKVYLGRKCMKCQQGYILTIVSRNNFLCRKLRNNFDSNQFKIEIPSIQKYFDEIFRQHLTRQTRINDDIHCYKINPDPVSPIECLQCAYRYFYSTQAQKCTQIQKQCLNFDSYSGRCYLCRFGYMVIEGKCVLLNTQNYLKGLFGK